MNHVPGAAITDTVALVPLLMFASRRAMEGTLMATHTTTDPFTGGKSITLYPVQGGPEPTLVQRIGLSGELRTIAQVIEHENGWTASMVQDGQSPPHTTFTLHSPLAGEEGV